MAAPPSSMWGLAALLLLVLAAAPSTLAIDVQSSGVNSTQLFCAANVSTTSSTFGTSFCPGYFVSSDNITSGYSGFSLGMTGAQGLAYHVNTYASLSLLVYVRDIPAAGGSIVAVIASGPNLGLATVTAALRAGTITSIPEPSTSTLVVLNITFPAASSSNATSYLATLDDYGNRIPAWSNARTARPSSSGAGGVFTYSPPKSNSTTGYYYWSSTFTRDSLFNASQWSTDPLGAIYITTAFANNVTIAGASAFTSSGFYADFPPSPPPPLAALRALPSLTAQLLVAVLVACMCM